MKRGVAALLLLAFSFFLAISPWEQCETSGQSCAPACHVFCSDGCASIPLAEAPPAIAPAPAALAAPLYRGPSPGDHAAPPELPPPRA